MKFKIRRQSPVKGGRAYLAPAVLREIDAEVTRLASQYRVSKSWVIATVLADAFGIKKQQPYYETRRKLKKVG